ncbi:uncharacterized protein [Cicer arietinum]|uniref:uncharacterized protein n=1 Tax=Cicer arietinum TaxID=3827 RepID=UPI003CC6330E
MSVTNNIFTNYITSPLSIEKWNGSNYDIWATDIKLWMLGQAYEDHLTKNSDKGNALYSNDTQRLYGVCHQLLNIITPKTIDDSISSYLGTAHSVFHDFHEILPLTASNPIEQKKDLDQHITFSMLLALYGLSQEYSATHDQILGSVTVPDMSTTSTILCRVPTKHPVEPCITSAPDDIIALVSLGLNQSRSHGGPSNSKSCPKCELCNRLRHTIDCCWKLHGMHLPSINATHLDHSPTIHTTPSLQAHRQIMKISSSGLRVIRTLVLLLRLYTLDQSLGWTIGVECETQGLYYLSLLSKTCSATYSPYTIHAQLVYPSLTKLQKMVPSLSKLPTLHFIPIRPTIISIEPVESATQPPQPLQTYHYHRPPSVMHVPVLIRDSPSTPPLDPDLSHEHDLSIALRMDSSYGSSHNTNGTWELVLLPYEKSLVGCSWLYMVKIDLDVFHHGLSTTQVLYGLKKSPRVWFGRFNSVVQEFDLIRSEVDHSVFYRHSVQLCIYLIVYVDDIVITGSDQQRILQLKQHLSNQFQTKDLGRLRYFLGIELLKELQFEEVNPMTLICDNQVALHIASTLVFHERTKHVEIDCHFVKEKIKSDNIITSFVSSIDR